MKKLFITFLTLLSFAPALARAQQVDDLVPYLISSATTSPEETLRVIANLKRQIFELLGVPPNSPENIQDIINRTRQLRGGSPEEVLLEARNPISDLVLSTDSRTLRSGSRIRFTANTYKTDLQKVTFTWFHNGKKVLSGPGEVAVSVVLGPIGSADTITLVALAATGDQKVLQKTVYPSAIHLTWYADSYTPPWYRGKALYTPTAQVAVVATPDFRIGSTQLNPKNLIYTWRINDRAVAAGDGTGVGKNIYTLRTSSVRDAEYAVSVEVRDTAGRITSAESITLTPRDYDLVFYQRHPLFGTQTWRAEKNASVESGSDTTLEVEPYYVPRSDLSGLLYTWQINGKSISSQDKKSRTLHLTTTAGAASRQRVEVFFESIYNIFVRGKGETSLSVRGVSQ